MYSQGTLPGFDDAISLEELAAGSMPLTSPDGATRKSGRARVRASRTAQPGSNSETQTNATCGPRSIGSSASVALSASLANRLKAQLGTDGSMEYRQTWKEKATPLGRSYWAHTASARRTFDSDCTGWPTAAARDWKDGRSNLHGTNARPLNEVAVMAGWPTPTSLSYAASHRPGNNRSMNATMELAGWATPKVRDTRGVNTEAHLAKKKLLGHGNSELVDQAKFFCVETADAGAYQLNPAFTRWLMGYPATWDAASPNFAAWQQVQEAIASHA